MGTEAVLSGRFPRLSHRGLILGLSLAQTVVIAASLAVLVVSMFIGGMAGLIIFGPLVVLAVTGAVIRVGGESGLGFAGRWITWQRRQAKGQTRWRARPERPVENGSLGLPGPSASLRVFTTPDGPAMVFDPYARTVTAVVRVSAPAFVLLDSSEQARRVGGWGHALAGLCQGGRIARVQVLERTIPDPGDELAQWWAEHGHRGGDWSSQIYSELIRQAGPATERHETYIAISLGLKIAGRQVRQAGGGMRGASQILASEMRSFGRALHSAGVSVHHWLGARDIAEVIRSAYDPHSVAAMSRRGSLSADAAGVDPAAAGPVAVDEAWGYIRTDSGWHAVYWIIEWPRVEAHASFLHPLLYVPGVRRNLSIVAQPLPIKRALREVQRDKVEHLVDSAQRRRFGQLETEMQREELRDVERRERELVSGHGDMRWAGFVSVSADSREALDEACSVLETAATQALVDVKLLGAQQAEAFVAAALPLGVGLR